MSVDYLGRESLSGRRNGRYKGPEEGVAKNAALAPSGKGSLWSLLSRGMTWSFFLPQKIDLLAQWRKGCRGIRAEVGRPVRRLCLGPGSPSRSDGRWMLDIFIFPLISL